MIYHIQSITWPPQWQSPAFPATKEGKNHHTRDPSLASQLVTALWSVTFLPVQHLIKVERAQAEKFTQGNLQKMALGIPQELAGDSAVRIVAKIN